jgi:hypothetical protein
VISRFFSLKAGSHHDEGMGVMPGGSSSVSIGELWPHIDKLDRAAQEGASMRNYQGNLPPGWCNRGMECDAMHVTGRTLLDDSPGLFLHVCEGRSWIGNTHVRPVWIEVSYHGSRKFDRSFYTCD